MLPRNDKARVLGSWAYGRQIVLDELGASILPTDPRYAVAYLDRERTLEFAREAIAYYADLDAQEKP